MDTSLILSIVGIAGALVSAAISIFTFKDKLHSSHLDLIDKNSKLIQDLQRANSSMSNDMIALNARVVAISSDYERCKKEMQQALSALQGGIVSSSHKEKEKEKKQN